MLNYDPNLVPVSDPGHNGIPLRVALMSDDEMSRYWEIQQQLAALANSWEPEASATLPARRLSKCAACARRMWFPWHFWLDAGGFKKELHVCNRCVRKRGWA